ncbi:MAG: AAA family ATPase [Oscillospiraceae bacterium]
MEAVCVAFVSGKGGTGKSTSAVFLGGELAKRMRRVLLIELDSGLRSVDIIAGVSSQTVYDIEDVLSGRCAPAKAVVQSPAYKGLWVISAPYAGGPVLGSRLKLLCDKMRPFFDYILLDTAAGIGDAYRAATVVADQVVLVLTADPIALRDGRIIADDLQAGQKPLRMILNKVDRAGILKDGLLRDLDEAVDIAGVQLLGVVPNSKMIYMAGLEGTGLPEDCLEQSVYAAIAARIEGENIPLIIK